MPQFANPRPGLAISAGTGYVQTGQVILENSNGFTFGAVHSASSLVVTASFGGGGGGVAISAGTTLATDQVVFANSNGVSFGMNGSTITAQFGSQRFWNNSLLQDVPNLFENALLGEPVAQPNYQGVLGLQHITFDQPCSFTRADMCMLYGQGSNNSYTFNATVIYTLSLGLYTLSHSTASLFTSASATSALVFGADFASGNISWQSIPLGTWNLTPGDYMIATVASASTFVSGGTTVSNFCIGAAGSVPPMSLLAPGGGNFSNNWGNGTYSTMTAALPSSIQLSELAQTLSTFSNATTYSSQWAIAHVKMASS